MCDKSFVVVFKSQEDPGKLCLLCDQDVFVGAGPFLEEQLHLGHVLAQAQQLAWQFDALLGDVVVLLPVLWQAVGHPLSLAGQRKTPGHRVIAFHVNGASF